MNHLHRPQRPILSFLFTQNNLLCLLHPTEQTSVNAGTSDCGAGGEDLEPTAVLLPWSKFDHPDMAQAAGDANSSLSNYTPWASASTPSAEVVQQPPHGSSSTQVGQSQSHSQMPRSSPLVEGQHIQLSPSQARGDYNRCLTSWLGAVGQKRYGNSFEALSGESSTSMS